MESNLNCEEFQYYQAYIERLMAPEYSTCGKCKRPWKFVEHHSTSISKTNSCFPLCESCWQELQTPENRLPYYRKMWLKWLVWDGEAKWEVFEKAVLKEVE